MSRHNYSHHPIYYNEQYNRGIHGRSEGNQRQTQPTWQQGNNVPNSQPKSKVGSPRNQDVEFVHDNAPLGHFYPAEFKLDGTTFNCVQQYILYKKAEMFQTGIMQIQPSQLHKYGEAGNFETEDWSKALQTVVQRGNVAKFDQNPKLKTLLLKTYPRKLVHKPGVWYQNKWRGQNILGEVLTRIRNNLVQEGLKEARVKYEYFWQKHSPYSQWHSASFWIGDFVFNCTEQFMMYKKAELFEDWPTAQQILKEKNPFNQKALGRKVRYFDEQVWNEHCENIVEEGNMAKNPELQKLLLATYPRQLVEASPVDRIWGIGLDKEHPLAWDEKTWRGKNLLGKALTRVRNKLLAVGKEEVKFEEKEKKTKTLSDEDFHACVYGSKTTKYGITEKKRSQNPTMSHRENVDERSVKQGDGEEDDWCQGWTPTDEELSICDIALNEKKGSQHTTLSVQETSVQEIFRYAPGDVKVVNPKAEKSKAKEETQRLLDRFRKPNQTGTSGKLKRLAETSQGQTIDEKQGPKRRKLEDDSKTDHDVLRKEVEVKVGKS